MATYVESALLRGEQEMGSLRVASDLDLQGMIAPPRLRILVVMETHAICYRDICLFACREQIDLFTNLPLT